jgi:hypothetical protein
VVLAGEVSQLHDFRFKRRFGSKRFERVVNGQDRILAILRGDDHMLHVYPFPFTPVPHPNLLSRPVHQDPTHRLRGRSKKWPRLFHSEG